MQHEFLNSADAGLESQKVPYSETIPNFGGLDLQVLWQYYLLNNSWFLVYLVPGSCLFVKEIMAKGFIWI